MEGPARNPAPIQCHAWFKPTKPYISGKENAHANSNYSDRSCDHLETANSISTESVYQPASPWTTNPCHACAAAVLEGHDVPAVPWNGQTDQQPSLEAIPSRVASGHKVRTNCRSVQTSFSFPQPLACQSNGIPEQRLKPIGCRAQSDDECITGSPNPEATGTISSTGDDAPFSAGSAVNVARGSSLSNEASLQHLASHMRAAPRRASVAGASNEIRIPCTPSMIQSAGADNLDKPLCDTWSTCDHQQPQLSPSRCLYVEDNSVQSAPVVDAVTSLFPVGRNDYHSRAQGVHGRSKLSPEGPHSPQRAAALLPSHISMTVNSPLSRNNSLCLYQRRKLAGDRASSRMLGRPPIKADEAASKPVLTKHQTGPCQRSDIKHAVSSAVVKADEVLMSLRLQKSWNSGSPVVEHIPLEKLATVGALEHVKQPLKEASYRSHSMPRSLYSTGVAVTRCMPKPQGKVAPLVLKACNGIRTCGEDDGACQHVGTLGLAQAGVSSMHSNYALLWTPPPPLATAGAGPWADSLRKKLQNLRAHGSVGMASRYQAAEKPQEAPAKPLQPRPRETARPPVHTHMLPGIRQTASAAAPSLPSTSSRNQSVPQHSGSKSPPLQQQMQKRILDVSSMGTTAGIDTKATVVPSSALLARRPPLMGVVGRHAQASRAAAAPAIGGLLRQGCFALPHRLSKTANGTRIAGEAHMSTWGRSQQHSPYQSRLSSPARPLRNGSCGSTAHGPRVRPLAYDVSSMVVHVPDRNRGMSCPRIPCRSPLMAPRELSSYISPQSETRGEGVALSQKLRSTDAACKGCPYVEFGGAGKLLEATLVERIREAQGRVTAESNTGHRGRTAVRATGAPTGHHLQLHTGIVAPDGRQQAEFKSGAGRISSNNKPLTTCINPSCATPGRNLFSPNRVCTTCD